MRFSPYLPNAVLEPGQASDSIYVSTPSSLYVFGGGWDGEERDITFEGFHERAR